jgi:Phosphotransferase enzyme family
VVRRIEDDSGSNPSVVGGRKRLPSGDGEPLAPRDVIRAALSGGIVSAAEIVDHDVSVDLVGRSHPVFRLSVDGVPRAFIKSFGPSRGATDGKLAREQAVADLAADRPALAAVVPPVFAWIAPAGAIATVALDGIAMGETTPAITVEERLADWTAFTRTVAGPLATFHRATRDLARPGASAPVALQGEIPWVLRVFDGDGPEDLWASPALVQVLSKAAAQRATVAGIRAARASWRAMCLIHCDLKHDNVLLVGAADAAHPVFVDWEMARLGDPAWDVAALTARPVMVDQGHDCWNPANIDAVAGFVAAYASASALPAPAVARRTILYIGAWLLMAAIQYRSTLAVSDDGASAEGLVESCHATFADLETICQSIVGCLT